MTIFRFKRLQLTAVLVGLLPGAWSQPAKATFLSGADLLELCAHYPAHSGDDQSKALQCLLYVQGVADAIMTLDDDKDKRTVCFPEAINAGILMDVTTKYLKDHPEQLKYDASSTLIVAWQAAFSCGPII